MRSTDGGLTWEGPFFVSPIPDTEPLLPGWPSPAGLRASALPLDDGSVGVAAYGLLRGDGNPSNVWFMVSEDSGVTWAPRACIANDPDGHHHYNETGVYQCDSGKLVAFMRVEHDPDKRLHTSVSHDRGRTWSPVRPEELRGYPHVLRLADGTALVTYYHNTDTGTRHVAAAVVAEV